MDTTVTVPEDFDDDDDATPTEVEVDVDDDPPIKTDTTVQMYDPKHLLVLLFLLM